MPSNVPTNPFRAAPRVAFAALAALALAPACGRDQIQLLGFSARSDAQADDGAVGVDAELADAARLDGAAPPDASVGVDAPGRPDAAPSMCRVPDDCTRALGPPPPCDGTPAWRCLDGLCAPGCSEPTRCEDDCDCEVGLVCGRGACVPLGRPSTCCTDPTCTRGRCVNPDGTSGLCGEPDAGVPDAGRDAGVGTDGGAGQRCANDCDCAEPLVCGQGGRCGRGAGRANRCCTAQPCPAGTACVEPGGGMGQCPSPPLVIGESCIGGLCGGGGFCIDENSGFPGGYCTAVCDAASPCPGDARCIDVEGGGGNGSICFDGCASAMDCRAEYLCVQLGMSGRVCVPTPPASTNPMGLPVGESCAQDDTCAAGLSCLDDQQGFPGGYCTRLFCDPQTNPCPGGSACFALSNLFSACLEICPSGGGQSTCRPNYECAGPIGQPGVCVPR